MPSANEAQTRKINSIYYAVDDPHHCKSHDHGTDARVGAASPEGFWLMQGPLSLNWRAPRYPRIENASLTSANWGRPDRVQAWLDCNVHVQGRPEWLFVKLHTHGAVEWDFDALFGDKALRMHETLNEMCNDGRRYKLHYVTARQAYNLAKAAERGLDGDPSQYLDLVIDRPATNFYALAAPHDLRYCTAQRLHIDGIDAGGEALLRTRVGDLRTLQGPLGALEIDADAAGGARLLIEANAPGDIVLRFARPTAVHDVIGADGLQRLDDEGLAWRLAARGAGPLRLVHRAADRAAVPA
jgi:hypothetical protein